MDIKASILKEARKARGLNQAELAKRVGTDQGHISRIERGEKGVTTKTLTAIARELNIPLGRLLGEEVKETRDAHFSGNPLQDIQSSYDTPAGLRKLATDKKLADALDIKPEEWEMLASIKLLGEVSKDGYVQLLITMRAVTQ